MDAAGQIFFSLGIGFGTLTLFSTGNKPKNSCYMDALLCALGNCGTSVWAGIIMFSLFGFKADYKVKECQTDHNSSFESNCSTPSLPCSKDEVLDNVSTRAAFTISHQKPSYIKNVDFVIFDEINAPYLHFAKIPNEGLPNRPVVS